jgi:Arc/MetJ-type ribon-helix-helix transcriptional regulator
MSVPVTTRLDQKTVKALDQAVAAGQGANRGALINQAVRQWLALHSEDAIAASYRHRYAEPDPRQDGLVARIGAFSAAACLDDDKG